MRRISLLMLSVLLSCCGGDDTPDTPDAEFDRKALLSNYASEIIQPRYAEYKAGVDALSLSVETFASDPSGANLSALREKWKVALKSWQRVSTFEIGPAAQVLLRENTNLYPVDTTVILSNISSGDYNLASVSNYSAKGFQAVDYLLYGAGSNESEVVSWYSDSAMGSNRIAYLNDLAVEMKMLSDSVTNSWDSYAEVFAENDGTDVGSALGELTNAFNRYWEVYVRDGKIGIPAGARSFSGTPIPENVEAYYYGDFSVELCEISVMALRDLYLGKTESGDDKKGLDDYLQFSDQSDLDKEIQGQFDAILLKLEALNDPLKQEVSTNQDQVIEVFDEMQRLAILLKVDLPAALGILITYADNDGD